MPFIQCAFSPAGRAHTHMDTLRHTDAYTLADQCTLSHIHIFSGGQAGRLPGTKMDTCWDQSSVWFSNLSLFQSLPWSSYHGHPTPTPPCSFCPLFLWKHGRFKCIMHPHQRNVPGPAEAIRYLWLKSAEFFSLVFFYKKKKKAAFLSWSCPPRPSHSLLCLPGFKLLNSVI